jgi:hypothetical protein
MIRRHVYDRNISIMADKTLLLKNADLLCTMEPRDAGGDRSKAHVGRPGDHCGTEIKNGGLFARNGVIEAVGDTDSLPLIIFTGQTPLPWLSLRLVAAPHHPIISIYIQTVRGLMIPLRRRPILACGFMAPADQ